MTCAGGISSGCADLPSPLFLPGRRHFLLCPWTKGILGFSHTFSSTGSLPLWQLRHCLGHRRVIECLNSFSFYGEPLPYLLPPSSLRAGLFLTFPGVFIILPQALTTCSLQKAALALVACGEARAEGNPRCQEETRSWKSDPQGCWPSPWLHPSHGSLILQRGDSSFEYQRGAHSFSSNGPAALHLFFCALSHFPLGTQVLYQKET